MFAEGCDKDATTHARRETDCIMDIATNGTVSPDCATTVVRACKENPFNRGLCYVDLAYELPRVRSCVDPSNLAKDSTCIGNDNLVEVYCRRDEPNAWKNSLCNGEVMRECGLYPFDPLCNEQYMEQRTTACLIDTVDLHGNRCPGLIDNYCTQNLFDVRPETKGKCAVEAYNPARLKFVEDCQETPIIVTGCDTTIVSGNISVAQCVRNPFLDACSNIDTSTEVRTIRLEFKDVVEKECIADMSDTANNLFSSLCVDVGAVKDARDNYCTNENVFKMNCDLRDEIESKRATVVTDCISNGVEHSTCNQDAKVSDADDALTLRACIENPYQTGCERDDFDPARIATVTNCRDNPDSATGCNEVVANGRTVAQCVTDPFDTDCDVPGFVAEKVTRTMLCTTKADYFDALCDEYTDITTTRENFVDGCILLRSTTGCDAFVNACLDDPYLMDGETCKDPAFAGARLTHCGKDDNVQDVPQCAELDTAENNGCITNPFNAVCTDMKYSALRTARESYCTNLGSATLAGGNTLCAEVILDACSKTYTGFDGNVVSNPFLPICGVGYDADRLELCRGGTATNYNCTDTIELVCAGRSGDNPVAENPFDTLCYKGDTYNNARVRVVGECNDEDTLPTDSKCDFAKTTICAGTGDLANPFAALCIDANADEAAMAALANQKRIYCLATDGHSTCDDILESGKL